MRLRSIYLDKIGAYHSQTFDLKASQPGKNVTLIGGKNGSGKTTLLQAIKLGLFGCYAYGYKSENAEYFRTVFALLNSRERSIEGRRFQITLEYSEVENYQEHIYRIYRFWRIQKGNLKEEFDVVKDGQHLTEAEKEIYQSKMREVMPPHLFDLCLFNGEEIGRILNENRLAPYIGDLANNLFNLDLFQSLEEDLRSYAERESKRSDLTEKERELQTLLSQDLELKEKKESLKEKKKELEQEIDRLKQDYAEIKKTFDSHGGLMKEEWSRLNQEAQHIEMKRRTNDEVVKNFISKHLPFYINRSLLEKTRDQMERENNRQLYDQLSERLENSAVKRILESLPLGDAHDPHLIGMLRDSILRELNPGRFQEGPYIHRASFAQRSQLEELYRTIQKEDGKRYVCLIEENQKLLSKLQEIRGKLETNKNEEFTQILGDLESKQQKIVEAKNQLELLQKQLEETDQHLKELELKIRRLRKEIDSSSRIEGSYRISQKVIQLSESFRQLQLKKKLHQVQIETLRMLKRLFRKNRYIAFVSIDPITYEVTLKDEQGEQITKETLSAGEQELLILSLIWAMFRCSGRRVPFIFDTLLGRLDQEHKNRVIKELIPTVGEQVLILSTDSEIDEENYRLIRPFVAKEYSLNFLTEEKRIEVIPHYFHFGGVEASS